MAAATGEDARVPGALEARGKAQPRCSRGGCGVAAMGLAASSAPWSNHVTIVVIRRAKGEYAEERMDELLPV